MTIATEWTEHQLAELQGCLDLITTDGTVPGGVIAHGSIASAPDYLTSGIVAPEMGFGAPGADTLYDVASMTKIVATWPLIGLSGFDLDLPIRVFFSGLPADAPGAEVTTRQILTHTSGLQAETRFDRYLGTTIDLAELICAEPLISAPGEIHRYINRGFILLGLALAAHHGRRLDELAADFWRGLGMTTTTYGPIARSAIVAPTERPFPGVPHLWGIPHDHTAALLGGVAGHAGVFSTPRDLAVFASQLLNGFVDVSPLGKWLATSMQSGVSIEPGLDRGLGWIIAAGGRVAYHNGFAGTSFYLAPETGRYLVICTNAIYHHRKNRTRLAPLRALALKMISDEL